MRFGFWRRSLRITREYVFARRYDSVFVRAQRALTLLAAPLDSLATAVSTNMGPAANPLMKLANLAYIFCHVASRLMLLVVLLLRCGP